jgi:hypothetical protein
MVAATIRYWTELKLGEGLCGGWGRILSELWQWAPRDQARRDAEDAVRCRQALWSVPSPVRRTDELIM